MSNCAWKLLPQQYILEVYSFGVDKCGKEASLMLLLISFIKLLLGIGVLELTGEKLV